MIRALLRLARSERAASAAEFAMVLPLFIILLLGTIDVGRFMWEYNKAEKATQMGARMAVVTDALSPDLIAADFASGTLAPGELIPADALGKVTCTSTECTCAGTCPFSSGAVDSVAHGTVVARMQLIKPDIQAVNVSVSYSGSGFGFAGSAVTGGGPSAPEVMEISPLVTVALTDLEFEPILFFNMVAVDLPSFSTTLTAEDISGSYSN